MRVTNELTGLEEAVKGRLLERCIEPSARLGLAYERSIVYEREPHRHNRTAFVFPRAACRVRIAFEGGASFEVGEGDVLLVPGGMLHDHRALSAVYDNLAVFPSLAALQRVAREQGVSASALRDWLARPALYRRGPLLRELVDSLFYARILRRSAPDRYQETYLLRELFRLAFGEGSRPGGGGGVENAVRFIESRLFSPLTAAEIARAAGMSEATLFRKFRDELSTSPRLYVRDRRLDEARRLLEQGGHTVGEVGLLVGYEDFGSFSKAFKARFGRNPRDVLN